MITEQDRLWLKLKNIEERLDRIEEMLKGHDAVIIDMFTKKMLAKVNNDCDNDQWYNEGGHNW